MTSLEGEWPTWGMGGVAWVRAHTRDTNVLIASQIDCVGRFFTKSMSFEPYISSAAFYLAPIWSGVENLYFNNNLDPNFPSQFLA